MITRGIDALIELDAARVGRITDDQDGIWIYDQGQPAAKLSAEVLDLLITRGLIEDLSDDLMDDPIWAISDLGRAALVKVRAELDKRRRAEPDVHAARASLMAGTPRLAQRSIGSRTTPRKGVRVA